MHPDLLAAYLRTIYRVQSPGGAIDLRVGEPSPELDRLLDQRHATRWAWLTAVNPGSQLLPDEENRARLERLERELVQLDWPFLPGVAVEPDGDWPDEPSFLVFDPGADHLRHLAREHGQYACLAGERGGAPQLVVLTGTAPE
ncbi:MAG: DUF3293 domain-containing protein [Candidatus Binatia bacterium]